jgi:hypothetical protein
MTGRQPGRPPSRLWASNRLPHCKILPALFSAAAMTHGDVCIGGLSLAMVEALLVYRRWPHAAPPHVGARCTNATLRRIPHRSPSCRIPLIRGPQLRHSMQSIIGIRFGVGGCV